MTETLSKRQTLVARHILFNTREVTSLGKNRPETPEKNMELIQNKIH